MGNYDDIKYIPKFMFWFCMRLCWRLRLHVLFIYKYLNVWLSLMNISFFRRIFSIIYDVKKFFIFFLLLMGLGYVFYVKSIILKIEISYQSINTWYWFYFLNNIIKLLMWWTMTELNFIRLLFVVLSAN